MSFVDSHVRILIMSVLPVGKVPALTEDHAADLDRI